MSYPYSAADLAALSRLSSYYNGNNYDASTNPGGFGAGGHRTNFIPSLQDVALVGAAIEDAADAASTYATAASSSATSAAASVTALSGTSTTSVSIGTGSKTFTTQADKSFNVGTFVEVVSDANPTTHYMSGQVTAYSGTTLTISVPAGASAGSGSRADWSIYGRSGAPGVTGATGATGSQGETPSLKWTFGNGTADSDPGNGILLINNATYSGATFLYIDNVDSSSASQTTFLDSLDDSTTTANRGTIFLQQIGSSGKYAMFTVTGAVIDGTGYRKVPISHLMSNSTFDNGSTLSVSFYRTGNAGADGVGAGDVISDISSGTDGRVPVYVGTSGKHITQSSYGIGTSGANIGALSTANTWGATQAFAAITVGGTATLTSANANALAVGPNGSTNPTLKVNTATASAATGLQITSAAAAGGLALAVISSGTDENLTINAKGAGSISINNTATGSVAIGSSSSGTVSMLGNVSVTTVSGSGFAVGRNGTTNPVFQINAGTASAATGIIINGAAAGNGVSVGAISSGTNEALAIDAKGTGTLTLQGTATGAIALNRSTTIFGTSTVTSSHPQAFSVGLNGATNPALTVDASTASSATGISVKSAAATGRVALSVTSSGTDEGLNIDAKGSGTIRLGATSTGAIEFSRNAVPTANDGAALGTTALGWADLHLATGGIINWANGNFTATHSSGLLTLSGNLVAVAAAFGGSAIGGEPGNSNLGMKTTNGWAADAYSSASGVGGGCIRMRVDNTSENYVVFRFGASTTVGSIVTNGTNTTYNVASDKHLKMDAKPLTPERAANIVRRTKIWDFAWRSNPAIRGVGVFAQDAYEVFPDAITPSEKEGGWQADYSKYVPVMIAHGQFLDGAVRDHESRIAKIEKRLETIH